MEHPSHACAMQVDELHLWLTKKLRLFHFARKNEAKNQQKILQNFPYHQTPYFRLSTPAEHFANCRSNQKFPFDRLFRYKLEFYPNRNKLEHSFTHQRSKQVVHFFLKKNKWCGTRDGFFKCDQHKNPARCRWRQVDLLKRGEAFSWSKHFLFLLTNFTTSYVIASAMCAASSVSGSIPARALSALWGETMLISSTENRTTGCILFVQWINRNFEWIESGSWSVNNKAYS